MKASWLLLTFCVAAFPAVAQDTYPQKPIRIIVPYNAGGAGDAMARAIGKELTGTLGQPVIVENKPGASGMIGTAAVANAKGDAYTLLMGSSAELAINPHLYKNVSYNASDLQPVAFAGKLPLVLIAGPNSPFATFPQMLDVARKKPGEITFGSAGAGQSAHLAMELVMQKAGVKLLHVPYKGGSEAVAAVVGGQVDLFFSGLPPALPQIAAGKVKALAVSTKDRVAQLPDVPTLAQSGLAGMDMSNWFAVFAPPGVPKAVVERLHKAIDDAVSVPEVKALYVKLGIVAQRMSVAELQEFITAESSSYKTLLSSAKIKLE